MRNTMRSERSKKRNQTKTALMVVHNGHALTRGEMEAVTALAMDAELAELRRNFRFDPIGFFRRNRRPAAPERRRRRRRLWWLLARPRPHARMPPGAPWAKLTFRNFEFSNDVFK